MHIQSTITAISGAPVLRTSFPAEKEAPPRTSVSWSFWSFCCYHIRPSTFVVYFPAEKGKTELGSYFEKSAPSSGFCKAPPFFSISNLNISFPSSPNTIQYNYIKLQKQTFTMTNDSLSLNKVDCIYINEYGVLGKKFGGDREILELGAYFSKYCVGFEQLQKLHYFIIPETQLVTGGLEAW